MKNNSTLVIGTRGSRLALTQAEWVRARLATLRPDIEIRVEIIKTTGDKLKTAPLSVIGGQGVFTKELEDALLDRRIDLAVHSLKDLPSQTHERLMLAATPEREDARDALVLPEGDTTKINSLIQLPPQATVGTSSPRRLAQLKHLRSDLHVTELRGNVETRLRKLDEGGYDAIILAAAGLRRLNLTGRITLAISADEMLPAVGQAALGLETRSNDLAAREIVCALDHFPTRAACSAERALLRHLGGGCALPIAAHAEVDAGALLLRGLVAAPDGSTVIRDELRGALEDAEAIGETLAARMLRAGAASMMVASRA